MLGLARVQDNLLVAPVRSEQHFPAPAQSDSCQMMKELVRGPDRESACACMCTCGKVCEAFCKADGFSSAADFKKFLLYIVKTFLLRDFIAIIKGHCAILNRSNVGMCCKVTELIVTKLL